jgi:polar amino acid transport system substrate-binding protein
MKSTKKVLLLTLLVALLAVTLAACGGSKEEPVPTAAPATATPDDAIRQEGDVWDKIKENGVMIVGVSADYPPFEYYNADYELDGFDIALMKAIGKSLDVDVEFVDIAFDGMGDALALGQIDVAISAISVTPEREKYVDFSQVYFVSEDAFVASQGANIPPITKVADLANLRVGVQKGSVFESWLEDKLVDTGLMPETNLFIYGNVTEALDDLQQGLLDVVAMDEPSAQVAVKSDQNLTIAASGLHRELYAIAMAKGQETLRTKINQTLTALLRNHVIDRLAKQYLGVDSGEILPVPTPTVTPSAPQPTPAPPSGCYDGMAYVSDLNYDDQHMTNPPVLNAGEAFRKGWRIKNTGTCTWDSSYSFNFVSGAQMGGQPTAIQGTVAPGQTYDMYVDLVAPTKPGVYQGFWQMHNGNGEGFGQRVYVGIRVGQGPTPTPFPTATPAPGVQFWADTLNLNQGQCTVVHWRTDNVKEVYYYQEGQDWRQHGVAGTGDVQECPPQSTTYFLRVVHNDDSVEQPAFRIEVTPAPGAPTINYFNVTPAGAVNPSNPLTFSWEVVGNVNEVNIYRNGQVTWPGAPFRGSWNETAPNQPGNYSYVLEAKGPGGVSKQTIVVQVVALVPTATPVPPTATPAPTSVPPTATPVPTATSVPPTATPAPKPPEFVGSWALQQMGIGKAAPKPIISGSNIDLTINADGTFKGFGGCDQYQGTWVSPGAGQIDFSAPQPIPGASACTPEVQNQQTQYFQILGSVTQYKVAGTQLTLTSPAGDTLIYNKK